MHRCPTCQQLFVRHNKSEQHFACGEQVCSKRCQKHRLSQIESIDPVLSSPDLWHNDAACKNTIPTCRWCGKSGALIKCQWCRPTESQTYCSLACQRSHWSSGHATECWRFGSESRNRMREPSTGFIDYLRNIQCYIFNCTRS